MMSPRGLPVWPLQKTLKRVTKFVARDTQMFLEDNRNISCLNDMQMTRETCCSLVTCMFGHPRRHAEYCVANVKSPSLAIA